MRLYSTYRTNQTARVARSAALRADQSDQRTASEGARGALPTIQRQHERLECEYTIWRGIPRGDLTWGQRNYLVEYSHCEL